MMTVTFEQSVLTCVSLAAVAVLATTGVVVCVTEFHLTAIRKAFHDFRRLPWYAQLFLVAFVSHLVVYGSVKTNQTNSAGGDATNNPPAMLMAPRPAVASVGDSGSQCCQPHTFPHWRHGVYEDGQRVRFDDDWVFPSGTNHLSSVEVMSWGEILPNGFSTTPIAALGCRVSLVPEVSDFHYCRTTSNSYQFVWNNARDRRINGSPISGCIELFRNGDVFVGTNGVGTVTPYVIPFHHDGFGQDEVWVRANFTNAEEILSAGYANWVDDQIGVGLTNGLFKFTAYFPEVPPEATELVVGDYSVCVTNSGEYVFVFEKSKEYSFHTEPYDETVEYSMQDDFAPLAPVFMSMWGGEPPYEWSIDGGGYWLDYPGYGYFGHFGWLPTLQGSPTVMHLGPDDFPITFEAILSDYCGSETPTFRWGASDENIQFATPNAQQTEVECSSLPSWGTFSASVEADFGWYSLYSYLSPTYGTNDSPTCASTLVVECPDTLVINNSGQNDYHDGLVQVTICMDSGVDDSGVMRVVFNESSSHARLWTSSNRVSCVSGIWECDVQESAHFEHSFYLEPLSASGVYNDGIIQAQWIPSGGCAVSAEARYTVVAIKCEQVCNQTTDNSVVNPCAVVHGGVPAVFRVDVRPESYPENLIHWSLSEPCASFRHGNVGREVVLDAISNASADHGRVGRLFVSVGSSTVLGPGYTFDPEVSAKTVTLRPFVVVDDKTGTNIDYRIALQALLPELNRIYSQVGVRFVVGQEVAPIVGEQFMTIDIHNFNRMAELYSQIPNGIGIPICFICELKDMYSDGEVLGLWTGSCVLLNSSAVTAQIVAHELGHAAGLGDIYDKDALGVQLQDDVDRSALPNDWNVSGNLGYYGLGLKQRDMIHRLLMCGFAGDDHVDIPCGNVKGYKYALQYESVSDQTPHVVSEVGMIRVGLNSFNSDFTGERILDDESE